MLVGEHLIYFELHKTGCTHTREILKKLGPAGGKVIGKHNTYDTLSHAELGDFANKIKVGNIRNPWDWYVSLWAFGCEGKGGLYERVVNGIPGSSGIIGVFKSLAKSLIRRENARLAPELWGELYSDVRNTANFRLWLRTILEVGDHSIGEGYKESPMAHFAGLLTYRYIKLYTYEGRKAVRKLQSMNELLEYNRDNNFIDIIIRNEDIHGDLVAAASKLGYAAEKVEQVVNSFQERTNKSTRERDYTHYYDQEARQLVGDYEKFIIDKHGYQFSVNPEPGEMNLDS